MRDFTTDWRLPGRIALGLGLAGLGLTALAFQHVVEGLTPFDPGPPWFWLQGAGLLILGLLLAWPSTAGRAALVLCATASLNLLLHLPKLASAPGDVVAWVSASQVLGVLSAVALIAFPDRRLVRRAAPVAVGLMLILFGAVHWLYIEAIAGMIPAWIPGRETWPWVTGAANIAAGLGLASGVLRRAAGALVGLMFAAWLFVVHAPAVAAAPGDRLEWTALALCVTLIGVVWTAREGGRG